MSNIPQAIKSKLARHRRAGTQPSNQLIADAEQYGVDPDLAVNAVKKPAATKKAAAKRTRK